MAEGQTTLQQNHTFPTVVPFTTGNVPISSSPLQGQIPTTNRGAIPRNNNNHGNFVNNGNANNEGQINTPNGYRYTDTENVRRNDDLEPDRYRQFQTHRFQARREDRDMREPYDDFRRTRSTPLNVFEFMRKWSLNFSGRKDEDSEEFITRIKEGRHIMQVSDSDLFGVLPFFLKGVALHWYRNNAARWRSFQQFESAWRSRFSDADFQYALLNEARRRTQGEREPVADYLTCLQAIFDRLRPALETDRQIDLAIRNMVPRLQIRIDREVIRDFQHLEYVAVRKEKTLQIAREYKPPPSADESLLPDLACRDPRSTKPNRPNMAHLNYTNCERNWASQEDYTDIEEIEFFDEEAIANLNFRDRNRLPQRFNNPYGFRNNQANVRNQSAANYRGPTGGDNDIQVARTLNPATAINSRQSRDRNPCFNCGKIGHFFRECNGPKRMFCMICGRRGVSQVNCPNCNNKEVEFCSECGLIGYNKNNCTECSENSKRER